MPAAGDKIKAADVMPTAWTTYTPTLTQGATVTKTVTYARYVQIGKWVQGRVELAVTSAGTAATVIQIGLPVASAVAGTSMTVIGSGEVYHGGTFYGGSSAIAYGGTTVAYILPGGSGTNALGAVAPFALALASGDYVAISFCYEAA